MAAALFYLPQNALAILFSLLFYVNFTICFSISIRLSSEILIGIFFLTGNMFNLQIIFKRNDMVTILIFSSHENSIYYVAIYLFLSISFFSLDRIINIVWKQFSANLWSISTPELGTVNKILVSFTTEVYPGIICLFSFLIIFYFPFYFCIIIIIIPFDA